MNQLERLINDELDLTFLNIVKDTFNFQNMSYATIVSSKREGFSIDYSLKDGRNL